MPPQPFLEVHRKPFAALITAAIDPEAVLSRCSITGLALVNSINCGIDTPYLPNTLSVVRIVRLKAVAHVEGSYRKLTYMIAQQGFCCSSNCSGYYERNNSSSALSTRPISRSNAAASSRGSSAFASLFM